jgi:aspartyl-tRNA synthetase
MHHPFTAPNADDMRSGDMKSARANAYDCVYNGVEVGGGSLRIYRRDVQAKVFETIGLSEQETQDKFGWLLETFELGAPPHGGIAFGLDRLVMLLAGAKSIRCVYSRVYSSLATHVSCCAQGRDRLPEDRRRPVPADGRAWRGDDAAAGRGAHGCAAAAAQLKPAPSFD